MILQKYIFIYDLEFQQLNLYSIYFISLIEIRENFMLTSLITNMHNFVRK